MEGQTPTYRDLWLRIRDDLPKKGRGGQKLAAAPNLPAPLEGALQSLYANYARYYGRWQATSHVPTRVESAPIIGETSVHRLDDLKARREQEVVFLLAKLVLE